MAFVLVAALAAPYVPSVRAATSCACVAAALGQTGVSRGCCEAPPAIAARPFDDSQSSACCCDDAVPANANAADDTAPEPTAPVKHKGCTKLCACCIAVLAVPAPTFELPHVVSLFRLISEPVPAVAIGPAPMRHFHPPK
jgi:hypothetical protein